MVKLIKAITLLFLSINASADTLTFETICKDAGGTLYKEEAVSSIGYTPFSKAPGYYGLFPYGSNLTGVITTTPKESQFIEQRLYFIQSEYLFSIARDAYYNNDYVDICASRNSNFYVAMFINLPQQ
jgi:hypothetical protein